MGYLAVHHIEQKSVWIAGILITDYRCMPIHFCHTAEICPNPLQRIIWGDSLLSYIGNDVVVKDIFTGISPRPDILFLAADDVPLFSKIGETLIANEIPIAFLRTETASEAQTDQMLGSRSFVNQTLTVGSEDIMGREFEIYNPRGGVSKAFAYTVRQEMTESVAAVVHEIGKSANVVTPLDRVKQVLYAVSQK